MSGHSHWSGIKHKKGIADQKRGQIFSKLLAAISIAARTDPNPEFNPRLRTAVQKAREAKVPNENIERAIKRANEAGAAIEELLLGAIGPAGSQLLIEATTDNKNRTIAEIKKILNENNTKWAEFGSVAWAFQQKDGGWQAKFPQQLNEEDKSKLAALVKVLEDHNDIQRVYANSN